LYRSTVGCLLKIDLFSLKQVSIIVVLFIILRIAKLMRGVECVAITYCKRVHNYLDTSEGSISDVWLRILIYYLHIREGFIAQVG
jgi:hypothetical protein